MPDCIKCLNDHETLKHKEMKAIKSHVILKIKGKCLIFIIFCHFFVPV